MRSTMADNSDFGNPQNPQVLQERRVSEAASAQSSSASRTSSSNSLAQNGADKPISRSASIAEKVKNLRLGRHRSQHRRESSADLANPGSQASSNSSIGPQTEEQGEGLAQSATQPDSGLIGSSNNPSDYEIGVSIGFGASAVVYQGIFIPAAKKVAVKMIDLDMFERNQIDELRREIQIMSLCKHPHVLPVLGSFVQSSKLWIVTPYLSAGSCLDIMRTAYAEGFDEISIATVLKQALQGLEYLHKNDLIHRDVKAGNLLVAEDGLVQLADFGVSATLMDGGERKGTRKTFVGTPCWMAPEVMEQSGYNYKADIWSFGITAIELATGHAPFAKYPPIKVLMLTLQNEPPTLDRDHTKHKYSKTFKEMIDSCLQKDHQKRLPADKLLAHPFFKQAKKKEYLTKTLLANLPEVTQRAHNRSKYVNPPSEEKDFGRPSVGDGTQGGDPLRASTVSFAATPESPEHTESAGPRANTAKAPLDITKEPSQESEQSNSGAPDLDGSSSTVGTAKSVGWNFSP